MDRRGLRPVARVDRAVRYKDRSGVAAGHGDLPLEDRSRRDRHSLPGHRGNHREVHVRGRRGVLSGRDSTRLCLDLGRIVLRVVGVIGF